MRGQLAVTTACSVALAVLGNHLGQGLASAQVQDPTALAETLGPIAEQAVSNALSSPLALSGEGVPLATALLLSIVPWVAFLAWLNRNLGAQANKGQHGSAKWASRQQLMEFATAGNPDPRNVLLLSEHYGLAYSRDGFDQEHDRNLNVFCLGGSGSGKTRYFVKPNVAQLVANLVVTDPKGSLLPDVGRMLVDDGYRIANFDTSIPERSLKFNPLSYLETDLEIDQWVGGFLAMTADQAKKGGDQFWDDSAKLFFCSAIGYLRDWCPRSDYNMAGLLTLLDMCKVREDDENFQSPLDLLFEEIETGLHKKAAPRASAPGQQAFVGRRVRVKAAPEQGTPSTRVNNTTRMRPGALRKRADGTKRRGLDPSEDYSLRLYKYFKQAAGKTMKSIIITTISKLRQFLTAEVQMIVTGEDQMHLELLAEPGSKYAVFDTFNDTNPTELGFLHGLLIWQAVQICVKKADMSEAKRLERPVQFFLDEFKSLNLPKQVADMISVVRSRNVGMAVIMQNVSQLYGMYDENTANGIIGCCDTFLYLGAGDEKTKKLVSDSIGQETVDDRTTSVSHQGVLKSSYSVNESRHGRALIDQAEVGKIARDTCLVMISGTDSAQDTKYPLERHANYALMDPGTKPNLVRWFQVGPYYAPITHKKLELKIPLKTVQPAYQEKFDFSAYAKATSAATEATPAASAGGAMRNDQKQPHGKEQR